MATRIQKTAAMVLVDLLLHEEDDEDENYEFLFILAAIADMTSLRVKIHGYVENVIPEYIDTVFKRLFRMSKHIFQLLVDWLREVPEMQVEGTGGMEPTSVEKKLYVTLWYLGSLDTINKISDRFGIGEATVIDCRNKVIMSITKYLLPKFIKWPDLNEMQNEAQIFSQRNGFPGIVGALDGTHIKINKPKDHPQRYINRKNYYSIQLQAVCRHDMMFSHVFVGYPGSCHDARILRNSDLWEDGLQLCNMNYHVLGDGAYPLRRWLLTPFRDNGHLSPVEKKYNTYHSSNRVVIERSFGLLKGRFTRLQNLHTKCIETAVKIIMGCCVLHCICLCKGDDFEDFIGEDDGIIVRQNPIIFENEAEGLLKRTNIARNLI